VGNAIARAKTPNMDKYWASFPHTQLTASGEAVGLPHNEDGNTETGHLNIGAGCIVYQDLPRINMSIADGSFGTTAAFLKAVEHVKAKNSTLHLMGLVGAGGVHSNIEHLFALLHFCKLKEVSKVFIHCFTDGRDSPPTSGAQYVGQVVELTQKLGVGHVATVIGRFFAMDRDKRWDRIEKTYNALLFGSSFTTGDAVTGIRQQYDAGTTDEFLEPMSIPTPDGKLGTIQDHDSVIFFNYRIDRPRELTKAFVKSDFETGPQHEGFDPYAVKYTGSHLANVVGTATFQRKKVLSDLLFVTMTMYEEGLPVEIAFPPQFVRDPICKVFAERGLHQLRIAETEKERFVTYYMNGQKEDMYPGEDRVILPSKGVKSYDQAPEMSATEITQQLLERVRSEKYDVIIANYANADMVGHTDNIDATIQSVELLDDCIGQVVREVGIRGGVVFITADHGNAEEMINMQTGAIDTEHSTYPVPFVIIGKQFLNQATTLPTGILADVAPTILAVMGIKRPESMTGRALLNAAL
jgi:2,3-bisphosphoglycerate-independent phosphoglycerate mutase